MASSDLYRACCCVIDPCDCATESVTVTWTGSVTVGTSCDGCEGGAEEFVQGTHTVSDTAIVCDQEPAAGCPFPGEDTFDSAEVNRCDDTAITGDPFLRVIVDVMVAHGTYSAGWSVWVRISANGIINVTDYAYKDYGCGLVGGDPAGIVAELVFTNGDRTAVCPQGLTYTYDAGQSCVGSVDTDLCWTVYAFSIGVGGPPLVDFDVGGVTVAVT